MYLGALGRFGDVVADGMTWITYGNEILGRPISADLSREAGHAAGNIDLFLENRGVELDAVSPETTMKLVDMKMNLIDLSKGTYRPKSVLTEAVKGATDSLTESGEEILWRAKQGAQGVIDAPGKAYGFVKSEGGKLIDYLQKKGKEIVKEGTVPLALIVGGAVAVAYIIYSNKK